MSEAALGSQEPGGQRGDRSRTWLRRLSEGSGDDVLEPADVDQVEGEGAVASLFDALTSVLLAQPDELLRLAKLGPWDVAGEELLHEATDALAELLGLGDHVVRIPSGVGAELLGVVVVVDGAASRGLREMGLDQLSPVIDTDQRPVPADRDLLPEEACGHRVGRLAELNLVVGMDLAFGPVRGVEALAREGT